MSDSPQTQPPPDDRPARYNFDRVVRMTLTAAVVVGLFALIRYLADVLVPFAAAAVLAYLLNPIVNAFEHRLKRRWAAVGITLAGTIVVGFSLAVVVAGLSVRQYDQFSSSLTRWRDTFRSAADDLVGPGPAAPGAMPSDSMNRGESGGPAGEKPEAEGGTTADEAAGPAADESSPARSFSGWREFPDAWAEFRLAAADHTPKARVATLLTRLDGTLIGRGLSGLAQRDDYDEIAVNLAKRVLRGGWNVVTASVNTILGLTVLIVIALYLWFLLLDYPHYTRTARDFIPPRYRPALLEFAHEFEVVMRRYFRGQAIVALLTGVLFMVGFSVIGLPLAVPFGMFVGLLNMVPYLQAVALVPAAMLAVMRALEQDAGLAWSLGMVLIVFAVVQLIQDGVLTPRIMSGATGLRPVAILLGVFIWGKLLGVLGLLLAIPLTCVGIAYYRRLVLKHAPETTKLPSG